METERNPIYPQLLERSTQPLDDVTQVDFALETIQYFMNVFEAVKSLHYEKIRALEEIFIEPEERVNDKASGTDSFVEQESDKDEFLVPSA